jgi:large subunit ribosomal protein L21
MYAVIRSGGKQYRVAPGETIQVEKLDGKVGGKVTFDEVVGSDIAKAKVLGKIVSHGRAKKVKVLKYKTGGQYKIQTGHRQNYTAVEVSDIQIA